MSHPHPHLGNSPYDVAYNDIPMYSSQFVPAN